MKNISTSCHGVVQHVKNKTNGFRLSLVLPHLTNRPIDFSLLGGWGLGSEAEEAQRLCELRPVRAQHCAFLASKGVAEDVGNAEQSEEMKGQSFFFCLLSKQLSHNPVDSWRDVPLPNHLL